MAEPPQTPPPPRRRRSGAAAVAAGIFLSRLFGFLRDRAVAFYFGVGPHADVFRTALRIPNFLQNLLGEGTMSASFIPVYSRMLAEGRREAAGRFAGAVFGLLLVTAAGLAIAGILLARPLVVLFAPGYLEDAAHGAAIDRYALSVEAVRWIFPMTGVLVLSAWALGVLNSHRRFFLPYVAPVLWNAAIIAGLFWVAGPGTTRERLLLGACIGAMVGGVLQLAAQVPGVVRDLRGFELSFSRRVEGVSEALRAFGPVVVGRGAMQFAAYLDQFLASFLAPGAVGALGYALTLYLLPVALFAAPIAASELPELASGSTDEDAVLRRVDRGLRQMAFLNVPTAVVYTGFGFVVVGALYRTGSFANEDTWLTYLTLAGFAIGLVATAFTRLLQNVFYALSDSRTPSRIAVLRVVLSAGLGLPAMLVFDRVPVTALGATGEKPLYLGAVGLAIGAAAAAWLEMLQLRRALRLRLPHCHLPWAETARMALAALAAAAPAAAVWWLVRALRPIPLAAVVLGVFGLAYAGIAKAMGVAEVDAWVRRLRRRPATAPRS